MNLFQRGLNRVVEGLFPSQTKINDGQAILGTVEQSYGVRLVSSFKTQVQVFNEDPVIKESIIQFAQQIVSSGIFTTSDEYPLQLPIPAHVGRTGSWTAKECIDHWNHLNNLDGKILTIAQELDAFGNSFWNIVNGFNYIPVQSVDYALPTSKMMPIRDTYDIRLTADFGSKTLPSSDFIHFSSNIIGTAPFGTGIIYSLIQIPTVSTLTGKLVPSIYELRKAIRAAMKEGFEKFSFGNELWIFEGMSDAKIKEIGEKFVDMATTGQRIASNVPGDIKTSVPQRTATYDAWIKTMEDEFLMALANPSLKLGLEQGFTKATAEAATEMFESKIESLRREIKRQVENIWGQVLLSNGFDPYKANMKLHFGSPEVEYNTEDIWKAVEDQVISIDEARLILRESMKWRLESANKNLATPAPAPVSLPNTPPKETT
jgi:hypothetical protein